MFGSFASRLVVGAAAGLPSAWDHMFWFDGDTNVVEDGSGVSAVADRYGGAHSLTQSNSALRPATVSWVGRQAFQAMTGEYLDMSVITQAAPFTTFVAGEFPSSAAANYQQVLWTSNYSPAVWGPAIGYPDALSLGAGGGVSPYAATVRADLLGRRFVLATECASPAGTYALWVDGLSKLETGMSVAVGGYSADVPTFLNASANTTLFWPAPVGVIAATRGILPTLQRTAVMQRLADYYGILPL